MFWFARIAATTQLRSRKTAMSAKRTFLFIGLTMVALMVGCRVSNPAATSDEDTLLPKFDFGGVPAQSEPDLDAFPDSENR